MIYLLHPNEDRALIESEHEFSTDISDEMSLSTFS